MEYHCLYIKIIIKVKIVRLIFSIVSSNIILSRARLTIPKELTRGMKTYKWLNLIKADLFQIVETP